MSWLRAAPVARISSSSLSCMALASRFCVFWIRNTISAGMIEQITLIVSCQVSEKRKAGPSSSHTTTPLSAAMKVQGEAAPSETRWAKVRKEDSVIRSLYTASPRLASVQEADAARFAHFRLDAVLGLELLEELIHRELRGQDLHLALHGGEIAGAELLELGQARAHLGRERLRVAV